MLGSPKFGEGVLVPKVDFAEEVTELYVLLLNAYHTTFEFVFLESWRNCHLQVENLLKEVAGPRWLPS